MASVTVDADQHVALLDAGRFGSGAREHIGNEGATVVVREQDADAVVGTVGAVLHEGRIARGVKILEVFVVACVREALEDLLGRSR